MRIERKVRFSDGSTIPYEGKGDILVTLKNDEEGVILNVLYLPDFVWLKWI